MNTWNSSNIEVNGLTIHYTRTGGNKPPIVLAHGFSDDGLCWTPVAEVLQAEYDVIMVDARGHGRSSDPDSGYDSADHAGDIAGVITKLGLHRPAVLGHSMGAAASLALAGLYLNLPRAILLEDPPPFWMPRPAESANQPRPSIFTNWIVAVKRQTREEMIASEHAKNPGWSEAELNYWADSKLRLSFRVLNHTPGENLDWAVTLKNIICPVLLITADPSKGIVSPEAALAMQKLVPQTEVVNIPGAGHSIHRDQFSAYMKVIQSFLPLPV